MLPVNLRGVHAQRAVHENRRARQLAFERELVQHIDNLLRAPDGKRRDDDLARLRNGFADEFPDGGIGVNADGVFASAVGGFDLEIVHVFNRNRVAQNFIAAAAHVAAEEPAEFPRPVFLTKSKMTCAEPRMCPASRKVTFTPSNTEKVSS